MLTDIDFFGFPHDYLKALYRHEIEREKLDLEGLPPPPPIGQPTKMRSVDYNATSGEIYRKRLGWVMAGPPWREALQPLPCRENVLDTHRKGMRMRIEGEPMLAPYDDEPPLPWLAVGESPYLRFRLVIPRHADRSTVMDFLREAVDGMPLSNKKNSYTSRKSVTTQTYMAALYRLALVRLDRLGIDRHEIKERLETCISIAGHGWCDWRTVAGKHYTDRLPEKYSDDLSAGKKDLAAALAGRWPDETRRTKLPNC